MNTKKYQNYKELIYILGFIFVIFLRWKTNDFNINLMDMIGEEIFFLPAILFICLFYFYYNYYQNVFIQVRLGENMMKKNHLTSIVKECIYFVTYLLFLSISLSIWDFGVSDIFPTIIFIFVILSFYILLGCIYYMSFLFFNKFYYSILLNLIPILIYKYYIIWWKQYLPSCFDITRIMNSVTLLFINLCAIFLVILVCKWNGYIARIRLHSDLKSIFIYGCIECFSLYLLRPYTIEVNSFSFNSLLCIDMAERMIVILYWMAPKLFIIFYCFQKIYDNYKHNLVFYMTRIVNREKWLRTQCSDMIKIFIIITIIKSVLNVFIFKNLSIELLYSISYYFVYLLFIWLSVVVMYLIFKDESVLNYYLGTYFIGMIIISIYSIDALNFMLLTYSFNGIVMVLALGFICYLISVWILNTSEYYS